MKTRRTLYLLSGAALVAVLLWTTTGTTAPTNDKTASIDKAPPLPLAVPTIETSANDSTLHKTNGVLYRSGIPYSGYVVEYYKNGQLKSQQPYYQGLKEGTLKTWYADGSPRSIRPYARGDKVGRHQGWWENKQPQYVLHFDAGAYHGKNREWYENGQLATTRHFQHGREEGAQQSWTANGTLFSNYVVKDGRRYGLLGSKPCYTVKN